MIKINGFYRDDKNIKKNFIVDLLVDSFDDICDDKMEIEESDNLISEAIYEKYHDFAYDISVYGETRR